MLSSTKKKPFKFSMSCQININKKLLILSSWSPPKIGGPQNLYSLLKDIDAKDYCFLTSVDNFNENVKGGPSLDCQYYFFDSINKKVTNNIITKTIYKIKKICHTIILGKNIVKREKINLLIAISDGGFSFLTTIIISILTKRPYILFLFDIYKGNNIAQNKFFTKTLESIAFKKATKIIVTNEGTKRYYENIYQEIKDIEIINNSIVFEPYSNLSPNTNKENGNINLVFTGNIYWPQESAVEDVLQLVKNNNNLKIDFTIYCPNPPTRIVSEYKNTPNIKICSAPQAEMPRIQNEADILLLPLSWDTPSPKVIETATPGKLTDYLISGKPILIYAPDYAYITEYGNKFNFAAVVNKRSEEALIEAINKITNNQDYRDNLVNNAKILFHKNHNAALNSLKLQAIINAI